MASNKKRGAEPTNVFIVLMLILLGIFVVLILNTDTSYPNLSQYDPSPIELRNGEVALSLLCLSDSNFIAEDSALSCQVILTTQRTIENLLVDFQIFDLADPSDPIYGCFGSFVDNIEANTTAKASCRNVVQETFKPDRPGRFKVIISSLNVVYDQTFGTNFDAARDGEEYIFRREINVLSRAEANSLSISQSSLFVAKISLAIIVVIELLRFLYDNRKKRH